jgi:predicted O-methyltransferase YrrM
MNKSRTEAYCERHTSPETEVLTDLFRETHLKTPYPRMISGHLKGKFLAMVSHMLAPEHILEVGTFTGYSAICLAAGLKEGGILHTIEADPGYSEFAARYIVKAGLSARIKMYCGDARDVIPALPFTFDLVYLDAAKREYWEYYCLVIEKIRQGGILLADNALWDGKVLKRAALQDPDTRGIAGFNDRVTADPRVENLLLPFADGMMIARKL